MAYQTPQRGEDGEGGAPVSPGSPSGGTRSSILGRLFGKGATRRAQAGRQCAT
jgi:hypothetical protein